MTHSLPVHYLEKAKKKPTVFKKRGFLDNLKRLRRSFKDDMRFFEKFKNKEYAQLILS